MTIATADLPPSEVASQGSRLPDEYLSKFYAELRRLARARLAAGVNYTLLNTTDLVHESFLRLQRANPAAVNDSQHFLAYAATTMRSVIVDYVRHRKAARRGGGAVRVTLDTELQPADASDDEILDVHDALEVLATVDVRLVKVVEMRYFGGLTDIEIGRTLGVTERTVRRDWDRARLLLVGLLER
jgi:RNA polymerase sigma factor (TIGR02999 family)